MMITEKEKTDIFDYVVQEYQTIKEKYTKEKYGYMMAIEVLTCQLVNMDEEREK